MMVTTPSINIPPQSLAQKIIARAVGQDRVNIGDIVTAHLDLAMIHDSGGPRRVEPILQELDCDLFDKEKIVLIADHFVGAGTADASNILKFTREWANNKQVRFYDSLGICHVVLPEKGHLTPGMFVVGGDSHSPTGGAFGTYMFGIGATEMAGALATGKIWVRVPETIFFEWQNRLGEGVLAKDMILFLCGKFGMDCGDYQAIEYCGEAVQHLNMQERMTLSNMAAELGAQVGLIAPDDVTIDFIKNARMQNEDFQDKIMEGLEDWQRFYSDETCEARARHIYDASTLSPQIAAPHSPANAMDIADAPKNHKINVAYIGACTGAKLQDLNRAAEILHGKKVASHIQLLVAPASVHDLERAKQTGVMKILEDAGAEFLPSACGICAGYGTARLEEDVICISTTARNFRGRMGAASSEVWLASPYTVASSAIAGYFIDPRHELAAKKVA